LYGARLSYTRCREIFKECLQELGYDEKKYGLHSLRSGGATAAANNGNVTERQLKLHGRWKTDIAKDMYVHENVKNRPLVTQNSWTLDTVYVIRIVNCVIIALLD
jgi:hypothetical protein